MSHSGSSGSNPALLGEQGRLGPVVDLKLLQNRPHVTLHGFLAQIELFRDRGVLHAGGKAFEHFDLSAAQLREQLPVVDRRL